jgi:hypothetical protein
MFKRHSSRILILLILLGVSNSVLSEKDNCVQASQPDGPNKVIIEDVCVPILKSARTEGVGPPGALSNHPQLLSEGRTVVIPQGNVVITQSDLMTDPKVIALIAKFKRSLFEALIKEGFTEEQALKIVVSTGFPGRY